jgi:hypothetical protein
MTHVVQTHVSQQLELLITPTDSTHTPTLTFIRTPQVGEFDDSARLARQALKLNPDDADAQRVFKKLKAFQKGMLEAKTAGEARDFETASARYVLILCVFVRSCWTLVCRWWWL